LPKRTHNQPDYDPETTWPQIEYQLSVGSYGGIDDRHKTRRKKHPLGFTQPTKRRRNTR
jgi:hypothetical protein